MGESTSQIEWDIATERNALGRNLHELEYKTKALADWRTYYRSHPLAMIGLAVGGGVLLGALTGGPRRLRETSSYREPENDYPSAVPSNFSASMARVRRQVGDTWDHIADALLAVASVKAIEFVSEKVPGFHEQYSALHPEHRVPFSSGVRNA